MQRRPDTPRVVSRRRWGWSLFSEGRGWSWAQGIGQALYEHAVYDRSTAQLVTGSFMDYGSDSVVINAILDALGPLGIDRIDMPATPNRVWQAIRSAKRVA